jgi:hypothetical protein
MDKYNIILSAENQFAREVTLGVIYLRPPSAWQYLIPGMFIFDYLRRGSAISRYSKHFMFPRKLAMDSAQNILDGLEKSEIDARMESEIEQWLKSLNLYSQELACSQKRAVELLVDHYCKLLNAGGKDYFELIENAYASRDGYETHVQELTAAENEIDRIIIEKKGNNEKLIEKLQLEARQVEIRRKKILESIY